MSGGIGSALPWWPTVSATTGEPPPGRSRQRSGQSASAREYKRLFSGLPTAAEYVDKLAEQRNCATAAWLRLDPSVVSRWRSSDPLGPAKAYKPLSGRHILDVSTRIGPEGRVVELLVGIEATIHRFTVWAETSPLVRGVWPDLLRLLTQLVGEDDHLPLVQRAENCRCALVIAMGVLAEFEVTVLQLPEAAPVRHETIEMSLQFPAHLIGGRLMTSDWMKNTTPLSRKTARDILVSGLMRQARETHSASIDQTFCGLHAIHLLARYAGPEHRDALKQIVTTEPLRRQPVAHHMFASAQLLSSDVEGGTDDFAHRMLRDSDLCYASIAFDAMHYGDAHYRREMPSVPAAFDRTLKHIARRLASKGTGSAYASVAAVKLARSLRIATPTCSGVIHPNPWVSEQLTQFIQNYSGSPAIRDELRDAAHARALI